MGIERIWITHPRENINTVVSNLYNLMPGNTDMAGSTHDFKINTPNKEIVQTLLFNI